jgi:hypothetical protein
VSEEYWIAAYAVFYDEPTNQWYERLLYDGACAQFGAWAAKEQAGQ